MKTGTARVISNLFGPHVTPGDDDVASKPNPRNEAEDYQKVLGDRIRRMRRDRQLTQLDLARQVGVTNGQISTIERGLSAPSIGTLRRISSALDVPIVNFFESSSPREIQIVRSSERKCITNPVGPEIVELLAGSNSIDAVKVDLDPDQSCNRPAIREASDIFLYVLQGHIELSLEQQRCLLRVGDSVQTDGRHGRTMKNIGDSVAHLLEVRSFCRV
jgi:transcriptional regulator with XRE-family HTH domain